MRNLIVSIHVPKSGGTTFKTALLALSENVYLDYDDKPLSSDYPARQIKNHAQDNARYLEIRRALADRPDKLTIVHGHFLASKYATVFPEARFAIWFRDPVERLISHYYYWRRNPDSDNTLSSRLTEKSLSLSEFAGIAEARNIHCRFMDRRPLDQFDFVGITEEYDRSVRLFLKILYPTIADFSVASVNQNTEKKSVAYEIVEETRRLIEKYNEEDRKVYESARQRFGQLCKEYGV